MKPAINNKFATISTVYIEYDHFIYVMSVFVYTTIIYDYPYAMQA